MWRNKKVSNKSRWRLYCKMFVKLWLHQESSWIESSLFEQTKRIKWWSKCNSSNRIYFAFKCRDPNTGVFLWILRNFWDCLFRKTSASGCFLTVSMAQCYMDLKVQDLNYMIVSGFRVQVTGLAFCFSIGISCLEPSPDLRSKT